MYRVEAESIIKDYEIFNKSLDEFVNDLEFKIISKTERTLEFDLINCHPSIANALRRILIANVPTMAIHDVSIYENTTVFPDEYIAHRLGLIPLDVNPDDFTFYNDEEQFDNVLNFKIHKINDTDETIYLKSDDIVFQPIEGQAHFEAHFKSGVLICKMAPGHEVEMAFKALKGTGEKHAKWSPVSLCSYRLMPRIVIEKDFYGHDAIELKNCFSPGVIEIIDDKAVVVNCRLEQMSREVLRHEKFRDSVKILRESGWFCFTVESISIDPLQLVKMALRCLISSCRALKEEMRTISENCKEE